MPRFARLPTRPFRADILIVALFVIGGVVLYGLDWLARHPEHDPRAPLTIEQPAGWATATKLAHLRTGGPDCRTVLDRSGIGFETLDPAGEGACLRADRILPLRDDAAGLTFAPARADATCAVHAGLARWLHNSVQPAAERHLSSRVVRIEQLGTANCRRVNGAATGRWSEHATGNAIDIAGFVLADGRRVRVLSDWRSENDGRGAGTDDDDRAAFLREVRDGACDVFGTTLSPDYNALHADHLHLDQAARGLGGYCR
ncbi:extensin family protein [Croceicoccus ponticola]|uniref:Extensin family protein n=1 Tax=Croceicoccus ponticola TaxID=2217664 RepID=A0A437H0S0_9SPHN|nr:extensin family protein [Croceicoccus ponticola]RVQ69254.1 extensin family protein [Croceicoccus ponticola]